MTIKERIAKKYGKHKRESREGRLYTLAKIKDQSPVVYSADAIMKAASPRGDETTRCDDFVLCNRASVTGIYIVEQKKGNARSEAIGQLRAGAKFMSQFISDDDCCFFRPVLVAKAIPSRLQGLLKARIQLGNLPIQKIEHVKVGRSLSSIIPAKKK